MTTQRLFAFLLIGLQAAAIAYFSATILFPITMTAVALYAIRTRRRFDLSRQMIFYSLIGLAVFFMAKYVVDPHRFPLRAAGFATPAIYAIAQFFLVVQVSLLFLKRRDDRLPQSFPLAAAFVMICVADILPTTQQRNMFMLFAIALGLLSALYFGSIRTFATREARKRSAGRSILTACVLISVSLIAWGSSFALYRYESLVDRWYKELVSGNSALSKIGFSGRASLASVMQQRSTDAEKIVLRITASSAPGYLRGQVFDTLNHSEWLTTASPTYLKPIDRPPEGAVPLRSGEQLFELKKVQSRQWDSFDIWPNPALFGVTFNRLGTTLLATRLESLSVNQHSIVRFDELLPGLPYTAFLPKEIKKTALLSEESRKLLTAVPQNLDPRVLSLANDLFADCRTSRDKITTVQNYFRTNYSYGTQIQVPRDADPLTWFLIERPSAHCEYFASATALLLRLGGVPSRYVTGFIATEQNSYSDNWIARNKHAHAWVEAWDDRQGWMTVEATPASGLPDSATASSPRQFWESIRDRFTAFRTRIRYEGARVFPQLAWSFLTSPAGLVPLAIVLAVLLFRFRWRTRQLRVSVPIDPTLAEMQRLLARMDARLRKQNIVRQPAETLNHFASRIARTPTTDPTSQSLAEWYRLYASLRYGREPNAIATEKLKTAMK